MPFALAAGLSCAVAKSSIVATAGLAEIAAGAIAMGLGGYLAARGDAEHYATEEARERLEIVKIPRRGARGRRGARRVRAHRRGDFDPWSPR